MTAPRRDAYRQPAAERARRIARQRAAKDDAVVACRLLLDGKTAEARTLALHIVRELAMSTQVTANNPKEKP